MSVSCWRNFAALFAVAGGLVGLVAVGAPQAATAQSAGPPQSAKPNEAPLAVAEVEKPTNVAQVIHLENLAGKANTSVRASRVDSQSEVIDNGNGTKTVRIAAGSSRSDGRIQRLVASGTRFRGEGTVDDVSIAASSADSALVSVGRAGRRLNIGRPSVGGSAEALAVGNGAALPPSAAGRKGRASSTRGVRPGEGVAVEADDVTATTNDSDTELRFEKAFGSAGDLVYELFPDAVKESIVLASRPTGPSPVVYRFPIDTDGVVGRPANDGSGFEFLDGAGKVAFQIPNAFALDSRGGASTPGNAHVNVKTELVTLDGAVTLVVSPSMDWLQDPSRVYPVIIDPTVLLQPWNPMNLAYMPWGDNSGGASFSAWTNDMQFGNWWGSQWRSYLQFDPSLFAGRTINKATLNLRVASCDNQTVPSAPYANAIHVRQLTSGYYYGQPWPGPTSQGDVAVNPQGPSSTSSTDITVWAQQWAANTAPNYGLQLDMGTAAGYCKVQRTGATGQQTFIEVTYNDIPSNVQEYGLLKNFSFETGRSGWQPCYRAEFAVWDVVTATTPSGTKPSKLRSQDANGGTSVCQTVVLPVGPGKRYNFIASVHSPTGAPVSGRLLLMEVGTNPAEAHKDFSVSGSYWSNVEVQMVGQSASNFGLRAELLVSSPYTTDLDIDYMVLTGTNADGSSMSVPVPPPSPTPPSTPSTISPPTTVPPVVTTPTTVPPTLPPVTTSPPTTAPVATVPPTTPPTTQPPPPVYTNPWDALPPKHVVNVATGRCIFPRDYDVSPGVSVVAAPCTGDGAEAWVTSRPNGYLQIRTFYNSPTYGQQLCLDIDNFNPITATNEVSPGDGARAQLYFCTLSNNQNFLTSQQPQTGGWQLQPQTAGNPTNQQKCLDEDVNLQNSTWYPSWLVQHWRIQPTLESICLWHTYGWSGSRRSSRGFTVHRWNANTA